MICNYGYKLTKYRVSITRFVSIWFRIFSLNQEKVLKRKWLAVHLLHYLLYIPHLWPLLDIDTKLLDSMLLLWKNKAFVWSFVSICKIFAICVYGKITRLVQTNMITSYKGFFATVRNRGTGCRLLTGGRLFPLVIRFY